MKAFTVSSDCNDKAEIAFAETASKAKSKVANTGALEGAHYVDLRVRRAPKFDGRENSPPTLQELVEHHGWQTECDCGELARVADHPEFSMGGDRCVRCARCGPRCENCNCRVPDGTWCCSDCFSYYDGDRFIGKPEKVGGEA